MSDEQNKPLLFHDSYIQLIWLSSPKLTCSKYIITVPYIVYLPYAFQFSCHFLSLQTNANLFLSFSNWFFIPSTSCHQSKLVCCCRNTLTSFLPNKCNHHWSILIQLSILTYHNREWYYSTPTELALIYWHLRKLPQAEYM